MVVSGVLGKGSFRSVVAGSHPTIAPRYHALADEIAEVNRAHRNVIRHFYVRDRIVDNKFGALKFANGIFKFDPMRRERYHTTEVMESIRVRSFWMMRIQQQRAINKRLQDEASAKGAEPPQAAFQTADALAYFSPREYRGAVNWPNFWQHPENQHLLPKARWQRHPELKGITRVVHTPTPQANDY